MKKISVLILCFFIAGCAGKSKVSNIKIDPPGGTGITTLTASFDVTSPGDMLILPANHYIDVQWTYLFFTTTVTMKVDRLVVGSNGNYKSSFSSPGGGSLWGDYWVEIFEDDVFLGASEKVTCSP